MTKVLKQFTGFEREIEEKVNDFIEEHGILNYEVVGFNTVIHPETKDIFTSILIKYTKEEVEEKQKRELEAHEKAVEYIKRDNV